MTELHSMWILVVCAAVTALIRFLPFLVFRGERKTPRIIEYLGRVLPPCVMAMLVIYCLKGVSFSSAGGWLPSLIACAVVTALHLWKRSTLLSIVGGTLCYMLLVQLVF